MKLINRNYLTCLLICISFFSFAQRYSDGHIRKRDTLGVIKLLAPQDSTISIKIKNLEFRFGKETTIAILNEKIKLMEPIQNRPEYTFMKEQIDDLQKIISFIRNNKSPVLEPIAKHYEEARYTIETLAAYYILNELFYCDIIAAGNFELRKNGVQQENILKVKLEYSDTAYELSEYGYYLTGEKDGIWYCPVPY